MKPTNFTTPQVKRGNPTQTSASAPVPKPQGVPAIIRSLTSNPTAAREYAHAASDVIIPQPHKQRVHQLEDYVASFRSSTQAQHQTNQAGEQANAFFRVAESLVTEEPATPALSPEHSRKIDQLLEQLDRIDAPHVTNAAEPDNQSRVPVAPHIPAADFPELNQPATAEHTDSTAAVTQEFASQDAATQDVDTEQLVRAIATAVASVLTDLPGEQLAEKLQEHPGESTQEVSAHKETPKPTTVPQLAESTVEVAQLADAAEATDYATMFAESQANDIQATEQTEAPHATPATDHSGESPTEIPAAAAAWDVEAFRWPLLSNQLIASAADSIQELFHHVESTTANLSDNPNSPRRVAITGNGRGEGYTSITISLARWAAASGNRVLIVDADLASPDLTTAVGLEQGLSWVDGIRRDDSPAEVIVRSQNSNICVMPLSPIKSRTETPTVIYNQLGSFLGSVERHFDWIIIDAGPASQLMAELSRPDLLLDAAVLVGSEEQQGELQSLQSQLQAIGLNRFVVAQNSVQKREAA